MSTKNAFFFDAKFCSGCKACQAACKDKNLLPAGVLWRRVYEVTGGSWQQNGAAWTNTVFAYNLSISCNHCAHPKCAGVCPVNAYNIRPDGIVILDTSKCVGCGYCAWACPYGVPQYDPGAGHMTKCDLCIDRLDLGLPPACVSACPMRALDYGHDKLAEALPLWELSPEHHPFPLPNDSHTEPSLAIKLHEGMRSTTAKHVANTEELQPRRQSIWEDLSLIFFTLLGQLAVGSFWAMVWMFPRFWTGINYEITFMELLPCLVIGLFLAGAILASFSHLGTKKNSWRTFANLQKSWLSREILFTVLFGAGWLVSAAQILFQQRDVVLGIGITVSLGLGLIYSMGQVYRLRSVPSWNSWRTNVAFIISAILLGESFMASLLTFENTAIGIPGSSVQSILLGSNTFILLLAEISLIYSRQAVHSFDRIRMGYILLGMALAAGIIISQLHNFGFSALLFFIILMEEGIGRLSFYRTRNETSRCI